MADRSARISVSSACCGNTMMGRLEVGNTALVNLQSGGSTSSMASLIFRSVSTHQIERTRNLSAMAWLRRLTDLAAVWALASALGIEHVLQGFAVARI